MKKIININLLQPGDIVLTTSLKKDSKLIRSATNSDISHAMICVSQSSVMDSTGDGVQARNVQKMFYDDDCAIYILRTKEKLKSDDLKKIIEYARGSTGTSYSRFAAAAVVMPRISESGGVKQFCSRMVARAYASAGILLVANPDYCSPEELKNSNLLIKIEPSWLSVSADEENAVKEHEDTTVKMIEATQDLLSRVRNLDRKVESLNDIDNLLIEREELDQQISDALRLSGYLDHWRVEQNLFPWRYNPILIVQFYHSTHEKDLLIDYCRETLKAHEAGSFAHWETNLHGYCQMNKNHPRQAFQLLINLYLALCFNHSQRVSSAQLLLKVYESKH